jgi:hypothetical protein
MIHDELPFPRTRSCCSLPAEKPPVCRRGHCLDHRIAVEAWQRLKPLEQPGLTRGALRDGAPAVTPVQKPEHVRGKRAIAGRDDLDRLQISPGHSLDRAVRPLTDNVRVGQTHDKAALWLEASAWRRSMSLGASRAVQCSGRHAWWSPTHPDLDEGPRCSTGNRGDDQGRHFHGPRGCRLPTRREEVGARARARCDGYRLASRAAAARTPSWGHSSVITPRMNSSGLSTA